MFKWRPIQLKWLEELESGAWPQGRRQLFDGRRYCCLGVAASVCGVIDEFLIGYSNLGHFPKVIDRMGLQGSLGEDRDRIPYSGLASMNDEGDSFAKIARLVRANPERWLKGTDE